VGQGPNRKQLQGQKHGQRQGKEQGRGRGRKKGRKVNKDGDKDGEEEEGVEYLNVQKGQHGRERTRSKPSDLNSH
jgi:hypothetical protein